MGAGKAWMNELVSAIISRAMATSRFDTWIACLPNQVWPLWRDPVRTGWIYLLMGHLCGPFFTGHAAVSSALIQDPAVPMIQLPARFTSYRSNSDQRIPEGGRAELALLKGPGCVRHLWLLPGSQTRIEIHVDGAATPQVLVPLQPFFGVMHGLDPYPINCAAYTVFPNPVPDPRIEGTPGYNLYLPIPFSKECRISLLGSPGERAVAMTDWHRYDAEAPLTPYRLHATYRKAELSNPRGSFLELADIQGEGFLAGVVLGYLQKNHSDMVFHTGGMTLLIDGATNPHVIRGHNVEDDFGFTWGFNDMQTQWVGCPWHVNRGRTDQDGVFYRFFGPDPIAFADSMVFKTGSRGDAMESVVYDYRVTSEPDTETIREWAWQIAGPFPTSISWELFQDQDSLPETPWSGPWQVAGHTIDVVNQESHRGWLDLQHLFFETHHGATPLTLLGHHAYAHHVLESDRSGVATLRLGLDDWGVVWWNGEKVASLQHEEGFETAEVTVRVRQGQNTCLIKTNNTDQPLNKRLWALHAALIWEREPQP